MKNQILNLINEYKDSLTKENGFFGDIYFYHRGKLDMPDKLFNKYSDSICTACHERYNTDFDFKQANILLCTNGYSFFENEIRHEYLCFMSEFGMYIFSYYEQKERPETNVKFVYWEDIISVELNYISENYINFKYNIKDLGSNNSFYRGLIQHGNGNDYFGASNFSSSEIFCELINEIINIPQTELENIVYEEINLLCEYIESKEYSKVLSRSVLKDIQEPKIISIFSWIRIQAYQGLEDKKGILSEINDLKRYYENRSLDFDFYFAQTLGKGYNLIEDSINSIKWLTYCLDSDKIEVNLIYDENLKEAEVYLEDSYNKLINSFSEIPYSKRKYLFVSDKILFSEMNGFVVLNQNKLPDNIIFPLTHPRLNEVYVSHPISKNSYLPLEEYNEALYLDRLREFKYLMDGLGAKKIEVINNSKLTDRTEEHRKKNVNVDGNYNSIGVKGKYDNANNSNYFLDQEINFLFNQELSPKKVPYLVDGLVWYHTDLNWQRIVQQRMTGSLMKHRELITSKKIENLSTQELTKVNIELGVLFAKINVDYNKAIDINTISEKYSSLELIVDFEDVNILHKRQLEAINIPLNSKENSKDNKKVALLQYKGEVEFMLEDDGVIDDVERKMLNRKRLKYGLTEEEALAIEQGLMFNSDEVKYLEEYRMFLADGEITEAEKLMLDRYAKRYGIDKERQQILEKSIL